MNKKTLKELREILEKKKLALEEQLESFADKDPNLKGDWDTRFPKSYRGTGGGALEEAADEVEEYISKLPVEHSMELSLQDINLALEKIKKENYGKCEKCGGKIDEKRLKIYPEARACMKCQNQ
ncbi:MAG: TraR/DksA C4-type zinc finger protein [Candidatus Nealsonbacteria bacterium]